MAITIRTAVLLVAGTGSRLKPLTNHVHKSLMSLGSESILHRMIRQLRACGIVRCILVTGYCEDAVKAAVASFDMPIQCVRNSDFANTQNSISLACCAELVSNEAIVKLDGDLVLDTEIIRRILKCDSPMVVGVDRSRRLDQEAMKAEIDERGRVINLGKSISIAKSQAESIGIEKLDANSTRLVMSKIEELRESGVIDRYYEDVYAELIRESGLVAKGLDIAGLRWTEVDTLEDLELARGLVASSLD